MTIAASGPDLRNFLYPASIAIVGASTDLNSTSGRPLANLMENGYPGVIHPINRRNAVVGGLTATPSVSELAEPADLAIVALRSELVLGALEECERAGIPHAIVFASGFSEQADEEGAARARALEAFVERSSMRILGPNTIGYANVAASVAATFSPVLSSQLDMVKPPVPGPVAILSQSGGLGFGIHRELQRLGIGTAYVVGTGNELDLCVEDFLELALDDDAVRAVVVLIEGLRQPQRFIALARRAARQGTPIVAVKIGRAEVGDQVVASHTAHLAGPDEVYQAMFDSTGVLRVHDQDAVLDAVTALTRVPLPAGRRIAIVSHSGGAGAWVLDSLEGHGLLVPQPTEALRERLRELLPAYGSWHNPVDLTGGFPGPIVTQLLERMLASDEYDAAVYVCPVMNHPSRLDQPRHELRSLMSETGKPILMYSYHSASPALVADMADHGVACYMSPDRVTRAMGDLADLAESRRLVGERDAESEAVTPAPLPPGTLCEYEVKDLLRAEGLPVVRGALTTDAEDAVRAAESIGFPVVLKIQAPELVHKSAAGGVILGIRSADEVRSAYATVVERARQSGGAELRGVLVEEMVQGTGELIVGTKLDPEFGQILMVGIGGVLAEAISQTQMRLLPISPEQARAMLRGLRPAAWLKDESTLQRVAELVAAVGGFAGRHATSLAELDINPVTVKPDGAAVILDGWARFGEPASPELGA